MSTDFTRVAEGNVVSVNELVVDKPLFALLGDLQGKRLLDAGCGNGRYSRQFAAKGTGVKGAHTQYEVAPYYMMIEARKS